MAGTYEGGAKAAKTNKKKYGDNFYANIGAKGGKLGKKDGVIKGFAKNPDLARTAGKKGGIKSRRGAING